MQSQLRQPQRTHWTTSKGEFFLPKDLFLTTPSDLQTRPVGLATSHSAGPLLNKWATFGCPTMTGRPWSTQQMEAAIARGPHKLALTAAAILHFAPKIKEKVVASQACMIKWDDIKHNPPAQLKISPTAAVTHKSKPYQSILDLSFLLHLSDMTSIPTVNEITTKTAPHASTEQLGHLLTS